MRRWGGVPQRTRARARRREWRRVLEGSQAAPRGACQFAFWGQATYRAADLARPLSAALLASKKRARELYPRARAILFPR